MSPASARRPPTQSTRPTLLKMMAPMAAWKAPSASACLRPQSSVSPTKPAYRRSSPASLLKVLTVRTAASTSSAWLVASPRASCCRVCTVLTKRTYTKVSSAISGTIMKMSAVSRPEMAKRNTR